MKSGLALDPECQLRCQKLAEWWRSPPLASQPQRSVECTLQLAYRLIARMEA
jgi:hypothetical protein